MALPKRVKEGGIYYQGYKITVASAAGNYPIAIFPSGGTKACAVVGLSVIPDSKGAGSGDYFDIAHMNTTGATGGVVIKQIATSIFNIGGGVAQSFDFAALQLMSTSESLRVTYVNSASQAMPVYITVEAIK